MRNALIVLLLFLVSLTACADHGVSDDDSCDPGAQTGCDDGQVCEVVSGGDKESACFDPLFVSGTLFDLASSEAIAGARVIALDVNGAAVSAVALSAPDGTYDLPIPTPRLSDGTPAAAVELTLRADAAGYQTFPSALRPALPINTTDAVSTADGLVIATAQTEIGLLAVPAGTGTASIFGTVEIPQGEAGVLVVAETTSGAGPTSGLVALASADGTYRIFNVPAGGYAVTAYARGVTYDTVDVTVADDGEAEAHPMLTDMATGTVTGTVQIVNAPGGAMTSIVLAIESTFDATVARGQTVPGLRAPAPGTAPNITSTYTIDGVPPGRYVVLGAFENDGLVRDPDTSIGGTSTLHIEVTPGDTTTVAGFKITEALAILSPGATGPEMVTGTPTLQWVDDASEDAYLIEVFDAFGVQVWTTTLPAQTADPSVLYAGPALQSGMFYQFRVTSSKAGVPLTRTEDLRGVFFLP